MTISNQILVRIKNFEENKIFFTNDFIDIAETDAIRQTLSRLVKNEEIKRIAQGIYYKCEEGCDDCNSFPSYDMIAKAIADKNQERIAPTGLYAQNILGLSTEIPSSAIYLTDGCNKKVNLSNGKNIVFTHIAPKNFAFKNRIVMLINFAMKSIKKENIEDWHIQHIKNLIKQENIEEIKTDLSLMPIWIRKLIVK